MIDAQRRMAAIERETDFYRTMGLARNIEATNRLYSLQSTVARIQDQINPAVSIANALRENAVFTISGAQALREGIADAARDAMRLTEAERGIAEIMRRAADPLAGIRNSLLAAQEESNRFVARVSAATVASLRSLQQPLLDLNEYFRTIHDRIAEPYVAQVSAIQKAAQGIATIYEFARPDVFAGENDEAEELLVSDDELAALFATAFPDEAGPIDAETFERGVETIVTAINSTKDSRLQKAIAQYAFPLLLFLLTIFLPGQKPKELPSTDQSQNPVIKSHREPRARVGRHKEHQGIAVVTATILNVREKHSGRSRIVGKLKSGERVRIIQRQGAWTEVETNRARGWVVTIYLRPEQG
ncbi:MAG: hypothetical protein QOF80_2589 [Verrucomicrobiota bacterium]